MKWRCQDTVFDLSREGVIMGILNVTPDSFSDGGKFDRVENAVARVGEMLAEGAGIIDIGGESTRPGADRVSDVDEKDRVVPVIETVLKDFPETVISIDTSKASVAEAAISAGAKIINDVTGFQDPEMIRVAAETGAGIVVMHMQGTPGTMQKNPTYKDVVSEVRAFFEDKHHELITAGVDPETVSYDPGIGFGKTLDHNLTLLKNIERLDVDGRPLLLGVSRKSFIGKILGSDKVEDRNWPTVAITSNAREQGVRLHRVHEVKPNFEALRMTEAIINVRA